MDHFLRFYCASNNVPLKRLDPEVMQILEEDTWPGNVRELENLVQRLVLMVDGRWSRSNICRSGFSITARPARNLC